MSNAFRCSPIKLALMLALATTLPPLAAQEPAAEAEASAALAVTVDVPAAVAATAIIDAPAVAMEVATGYAADLGDYSKTVVVPTLYLKLLVEGSVFVAKQGSALAALGGGSTNSVKAKASYTVAGLDKAYAQDLARQAYEDFVARLRGAGYTVLTYEDIKGRDYVQSAARSSGGGELGLPVEKAVGGRDSYLVATPSDEMAFKIGFTGPFAEFISMGKPKFTDATVIIPTYTIQAPLGSGETGGGFNRISAEVNVSPAMNLQQASAIWMGRPKVRMGGGNAAGVVLKAPVANLSETGGALSKTDTTSGAANGLSKALSLLGGGGSISGSSADYTYTIDREAYTGGVLRGIGSFNAQVAKAAAGG